MNVQLDPKTQAELEALAQADGTSAERKLSELVHEAHEARARNGAHAESVAEESFLQAAFRLGAVGCVKGGPTDLATNPKHLEGLGED